MLMEIVELWDECLVSSVGIYVVAMLFFFFTWLATESKHLITGGICALITAYLGQISKIVFKISIFLAIIRTILTFI